MSNNVKSLGLRSKFTNFMKCDLGGVIAIAITGLFSILFSYFSLLQYYSINDSAYDLGMHAQVIASFLHGELFYSPLIGESLLAEHFTIFEFFQVPVYFIYQSPVSLLVFQDVFIAAGGYLLYIIAKNILKRQISSSLSLETISLALLLVYEMSPYTQSLVSFPFHSMAFLPFFFLLAIYSFLSERRIVHFFSLIMIITLHSNFVYVVAVILLYEFIFLRYGRGKSIKTWLSSSHDPRGKVQFMYFLIFLVSLFAYLLFAALMKNYILGVNSPITLPGTGEAGSPSSSPFALFGLLVTDPHNFFSFIGINFSFKAFYTFFIFRNTGYLPFLSPLSLLMTIPYLLYAMPSSYSSYYELGYQYSSLLLGGVFFGVILGISNVISIVTYILRKIGKRRKSHISLGLLSEDTVLEKRKTSVGTYFVVIGVVLIILAVSVLPYGIFSPKSMFEKPDGSQMQNINYFSLTGASGFLIKENSLIPSNAYILTENTLMPYFSNHINAYSTPWSPGIYDNLSRFTFLIIQNNSYWATTTQSVPSLQTIAMNGLSNGTYIVISSYPSADILVLERK